MVERSALLGAWSQHLIVRMLLNLAASLEMGRFSTLTSKEKPLSLSPSLQRQQLAQHLEASGEMGEEEESGGF